MSELYIKAENLRRLLSTGDIDEVDFNREIDLLQLQALAGDKEFDVDVWAKESKLISDKFIKSFISKEKSLICQK